MARDLTLEEERMLVIALENYQASLQTTPSSSYNHSSHLARDETLYRPTYQEDFRETYQPPIQTKPSPTYQPSSGFSSSNGYPKPATFRHPKHDDLDLITSYFKELCEKPRLKLLIEDLQLSFQIYENCYNTVPPESLDYINDRILSGMEEFLYHFSKTVDPEDVRKWSCWVDSMVYGKTDEVSDVQSASVVTPLEMEDETGYQETVQLIVTRHPSHDEFETLASRNKTANPNLINNLRVYFNMYEERYEDMPPEKLRNIVRSIEEMMGMLRGCSESSSSVVTTRETVVEKVTCEENETESRATECLDSPIPQTSSKNPKSHYMFEDLEEGNLVVPVTRQEPSVVRKNEALLVQDGEETTVKCHETAIPKPLQAISYKENEIPESKLKVVMEDMGVNEDARSSLSTCIAKKLPPDKDDEVVLQDNSPRQTGVLLGVKMSLLTSSDEKLPHDETKHETLHEGAHVDTQVSLSTKTTHALLRNESLDVYLKDDPRAQGVQKDGPSSLSTSKVNKLLESEVKLILELFIMNGFYHDPRGLLFFSKPPDCAHRYDPFERG